MKILLTLERAPHSRPLAHRTRLDGAGSWVWSSWFQRCFQSLTERTLQAALPVVCALLLGWVGESYAQNCSTGGTPTVLASWTFDAAAPYNCAGANGIYANGEVPLSQDIYNYCPTTNGGCGKALLGSKGHENTKYFYNAICVSDFYLDYSRLGTATSWQYTHPKNLRITYEIPSGKRACLNSMSLNILAATGMNGFGVTVLRNGVAIDTQTFSASPGVRTVTWSGSSFCTDGSQAVTYTIFFGFWGTTNPGEVSAAVGLDNIILNGTCGGPPVPVLTATPATCGSSGANSNGSIKVSNFTTGARYQYSLGSTFNAGSATPASPTAIPAGGVISSTLPNPSTDQIYTVRIYEPTGSCYQDQTVTLKASFCPIPCTQPTAATLTAVSATCTGTTVNNNAQIQVTGVVGGNKVGISTGTIYTGPAYSAATALTSGAYTFTALPNPTCAVQTYTVRIFANNDCYIDRQVDLSQPSCAPCQKMAVTILGSGTGSIELNAANNTACPESCKDSKYIDLSLTKTVSPSTGTTCTSTGGLGTNFVWTLRLTNSGTMTAKNIQVADLIPNGMVLVSSVPAAPAYTEVAGWLIDSLQAGQNVTLKLTTKALRAGTFTNCAEVNSVFPLNDPDSTPGNSSTNEDDDACASVTVTGPNPPTITKEFSPYQVNPNKPVRLTLKIWNNESSPITLTQNFIDNLPSSPGQMTIAPTPNVVVNNGVPVIAAAGSNLLFIPSGTALPPGLTQIQLDVIVPVNGIYCNVIPAGALQTSSCTNVLPDSACLDANSSFVLAPVIKKAFVPQIVQTNQNSTLTITVENRNSFPLTLMQDFLDILPQGLVVAGAASSTCGTVTATVGDSIIALKTGVVLQPGSCTITVPVKSTTAGNYCNIILMNSLLTQGNGQTNIGNQDRPQACLTVVTNPIFDLALRKTLALGQDSLVTQGDTVTYTIRIFNQGSVNATNIQIADYIPTGMTLVSGQGWAVTGSTARLSTPIALLAAGQETTVNIKLKVNANFTGTSLVNRAEISAASGGTDVDSTPDTNASNDAGGKERTSSDDSIHGNGTGTPGSTSALTDEDDSDPAYITVVKCASENLAVGLILAPKSISTPQDVVTVTFGVVNTGATPISGVSFAANYKLFKGTSTPTVLTTTRSGDVGNDGIMQPNESWLYTATLTNTPYKAGDVFLVSGVVSGLCFNTNIQAGGGDLLFTTGVNMDVEIANKCAKPGDILDVNLVTRLLIDEDAALNPGTVTIGGTVITLPKRRFEARNLRITTPLLNGGVAFNPFSPPAGLNVTVLADQAGADAGRNTSNILDESEPINTVRQPCTAVGQNDANCEFPDWVFNLKVPVPANYTGTSIILTATDSFDMYQANENPAGSGTFDPFVSLGAAGGADADTAFVWQKTIVATATSVTCGTSGANANGSITLTGFAATDRFAYNVGSSYTGTATYATATAIPANGIIVSNLANPAVATTYTVRVFDANGCFRDYQATLQPVVCCTKPNAGADQALCMPASTTSLTGFTPTGGTWAPQSGNPAAATVTTAGAVSGMTVAGTYRFIYTLSGGCADTVAVVLKAKPNAGTDQALTCPPSGIAPTTTTLTGFSPTGGTWAAQSGNPAAATVTNAGAVSGMTVAGTYRFIYTVNGCTDTVAVTVPTCVVPKGSIGDFVWKDLNDNGQQDAGEPGVSGVKVILWSAVGGNPSAKLDSTTTSASGAYSFANLSAGNYIVQIAVATLPANCIISSKQNVGNDATDNDFSTAGLSQVVTLDPTQSGSTKDNPTIDAALFSPKGSIGDFVWKDLNDNGQQDSGEPGVNGVKVILWSAVGGNPSAKLDSTTTAGNGAYSFSNLSAGNYIVQIAVATLPANCIISSKQNVGNDATDNDFATNGFSPVVPLDPTQSGLTKDNPTIDAGLVTPCSKPNAGSDLALCMPASSASLSGIPAGGTWAPQAGNPANASVSNAGVVSGMSAAGTYRFIYSVTSGGQTCSDTVAIVLNAKPSAGADQALTCPPSGIAPTTTTLTNFTPTGGTWAAQSGNPAAATVTNAGAVSGMTVAGTYRFIYTVNGCTDTVAVTVPTCVIPKGSIGDFVWKDLNDNGQQDSGEPGVNGVKVILWSAVGGNPSAKLDSTTTAGNGAYSFSNLSAGSYIVQIAVATLPANCIISTKQNVGNDATDNDFATNGFSPVVPLDPTQPGLTKDNPTIDAGLYLPCVAPLLATISASAASCNGKDANADASLSLTGISGADRYAYATSLGGLASYAAATPLAGSTLTITTLPNPATQAGQTYFVRLFNGKQDCYKDTLVLLPFRDCSEVCVKPDAGPAQVFVCKPQTTIDLPDAGSGFEWVSGVINPPAVSINAQTGQVSGLTESGVFMFILRDAALGSTCSDSVFVFRGVLDLPDQSSCSDTLTLPAVAGATWAAVAGTGASITPSGQISGMSTVGTLYRFVISNQQCSDTVAVERLNCNKTYDLALNKAISKKLAMLGDTLTYTLQVKNEGEATVHAIEVTDLLNAAVQFVSSSAQRGSYSATTKKWTFDSLASGETVQLRITVRIVAQGVWFNTAEITSMAEKDVDSTPGNGVETEDDIDRECFTVPYKVCRGQGTTIRLNVPAQYTGVVWFRKVQGGQPVQVGTGNQYDIAETQLGSYEYTFTSTSGSCPAEGCCPVLVVVEDCCAPQICVPFVIQKKVK